MFQMKTILFPVDFSDACRAASEHVAATAAHFGARLILLHVMQTPPAWYGDAVAYNAVFDLEDLRAERQKAIEGVLGECDDVVIDRVLAFGDPARAILECASNRHADLIMMPTHGCGAFRRFLLGSVTAKVLHDSDIPVWTDAHLPHEAPKESRCVICGVDMKTDSIAAIEWATQYAQSYGMDLKLLHAAPHGNPPSAPSNVVERSGPVSGVLRDAALEWGAKAIVIGPGLMHAVMGRMRSNAYAIVRDAPCPVVRC